MSGSPDTELSHTRRGWIRLDAALAAAQTVRGEELPHIEPPNEEGLDPALVDFLGRMRELVAARKHVELGALMAPTFRVEFDVGKGPAAFRVQWHSQSASSAVWGILERALALPGHRYSGTLYAFPFVCARFPFDLDPLSHVVATKD